MHVAMIRSGGIKRHSPPAERNLAGVTEQYVELEQLAMPVAMDRRGGGVRPSLHVETSPVGEKEGCVVLE
eukprot:8637046-Ditylum_brightwellii.AAC.1